MAADQFLIGGYDRCRNCAEIFGPCRLSNLLRGEDDGAQPDEGEDREVAVRIQHAAERSCSRRRGGYIVSIATARTDCGSTSATVIFVPSNFPYEPENWSWRTTRGLWSNRKCRKCGPGTPLRQAMLALNTAGLLSCCFVANCGTVQRILDCQSRFHPFPSSSSLVGCLSRRWTSARRRTPSNGQSPRVRYSHLPARIRVSKQTRVSRRRFPSRFASKWHRRCDTASPHRSGVTFQ